MVVIGILCRFGRDYFIWILWPIKEHMLGIIGLTKTSELVSHENN